MEAKQTSQNYPPVYVENENEKAERHCSAPYAAWEIPFPLPCSECWPC